jgi:hypothetical protein
MFLAQTTKLRTQLYIIIATVSNLRRSRDSWSKTRKWYKGIIPAKKSIIPVIASKPYQYSGNEIARDHWSCFYMNDFVGAVK